MRLLTAISIASLVVSIAAVVFVLGLYDELEKSKPETPKVHTQELNEIMVRGLIHRHVSKLIESAGITDDNKHFSDGWDSLPGIPCIWIPGVTDGEISEISIVPHVLDSSGRVTYNYIKADDIWLVTSATNLRGCRELTTWAIDDNTGEVTYGHPDEK